MSYVMTYASLEESLLRWTWRESDTQLEEEFPRLVDSTERKVARAIKTLLQRENITSNFVASNAIIQKPFRLLETISFRYFNSVTNRSTELKKRTYEYIRVVYPNVSTSAPPVYYADYDINNFYLGPDPDSAYPYELTYYQRPEPLGDDVSTNFLTEFVPDLMLYGLLLEASPFLVDANIEEWTAMYMQKLKELGIEDDDQKIPESQKLKGSRK